MRLNWKRLVVAFVAAACIGVAAGVLVSPLGETMTFLTSYLTASATAAVIASTGELWV